MTRLLTPLRLWLLLALVLAAVAMARPIDHDESQYVAAAVLAAHGLIPYRDFAYLQTPLQPLLFGPLAGIGGIWTWPLLRLANAVLGAAAIAFVYRAGRIGNAGQRPALIAAGLFACCDILLFSIGTARNDALPAALLAAALPFVVAAERGVVSKLPAMLVGLLLAGAAAAKISYALPAAAYGVYALVNRRHLPFFVLIGALPAASLVAASWWSSPEAFVADVLRFPSLAPAEYYAAGGRLWKLSYAAKAIDTLKFLALGPALLAVLLCIRDRRSARQLEAIDWLALAGLIAALLPFPTWRQYLLPMLPPLFVRLALVLNDRSPTRPTLIAGGVFAFAGLVPTLLSLGAWPMPQAMRDGQAIGDALTRAHVLEPVATLSPQFLPAARRLPDPRFATGPFYFRSTALFSPAEEARLGLVSQARLDQGLAIRPAAILTGGEGAWTSGDDALDARLADWATRAGYARVDVAGTRFRLYIRPR
ncbi:conserved membrane hypothetical protein [Sphingomonas sp. EC-HK361]|uniref:DUF2029 domain-containing protein n=1 Tax=Sphingomonas sp. EC-HK361 TaxID=2038397 RepID=UPI00125274B9|nr:DUF2029 domain-containing protein [Sphingomonas sp. EC-HK361]VVT13876.1 conserved membrane hypothetical protein [Sphingomonas sp. EC-HK361]